MIPHIIEISQKSNETRSIQSNVNHPLAGSIGYIKFEGM